MAVKVWDYPDNSVVYSIGVAEDPELATEIKSPIKRVETTVAAYPPVLRHSTRRHMAADLPRSAGKLLRPAG